MKKETEKKRKKRKPFHHLKQPDRDRIEALLDAGHTQEEIATILQFNPGAISREVTGRQTKDGRYVATLAQGKANVKRSNSKYQGMKIEQYPELKADLIALLMQLRSPDEISGRWKQEKRTVRVNTDAIYKWLHSSWGQPYCKYLCTRRYKKRKQTKKTKREMIKDAIPLALRPIEGIHAESDLFVSSKRSGTQRSGMVTVVPLVKLMAGIMVSNKKPSVFAEAMRTVSECVLIDDVTLDRGIENRDYQAFGLPAYFCDPHSPWQKPHVENGIGLLRRWFIKKGTNLMEVSEEYFQECLHILNHKWRKSLGYRSAYEVALERGIIQKIPVLWTGEVIAISREINRLEVAFH
jgi:IS30 family transposase